MADCYSQVLQATTLNLTVAYRNFFAGRAGFPKFKSKRRWFPSSKLCSNCFYQVEEMPLDVREWTCPNCGKVHDRDGNAAHNIRAEGIRILALSEVEGLQADGTAVSAVGGSVRPKRGRKSKLRHEP